jgi:hypothetical protein
MWQNQPSMKPPVPPLTPPVAVARPEQTKPPAAEPQAPASRPLLPVEVGGRDGPEPTRFGDWEKAGRCIDF